MFNNPKYLTKGIAAELPLALQLCLWQIISDLSRRISLDYLQVFRLEAISINGLSFQQITHSQELPPYKNTVTIRFNQPVSNRKIFCIDDQTHSTMLFAEEY